MKYGAITSQKHCEPSSNANPKKKKWKGGEGALFKQSRFFSSDGEKKSITNKFCALIEEDANSFIANFDFILLKDSFSNIFILVIRILALISLYQMFFKQKRKKRSLQSFLIERKTKKVYEIMKQSL